MRSNEMRLYAYTNISEIKVHILKKKKEKNNPDLEVLHCF